MLGIDPAATAKAMVLSSDGEVVLALVRGDDRLHELKLTKALGGDVPAGHAGGDRRHVRRRAGLDRRRSARACG